MLSSALIGCFTVPLISKKETQGGKYIFKYFLSQLFRRVIILYIMLFFYVLWNGKIPWMLKVLHENIDANKEPLLYMDCCFIIS